jgi:hypothetical protein
MDLDLSHGLGYGDTLIWTGKLKRLPVRQWFTRKMFLELMMRCSRRFLSGLRISDNQTT